MQTCQKTCSRTVVNYVPHTAYRTNWTQVPVTQYKPVTNTDPCTGCTVTCMRPCTTYTYQMQRVPYTTYRPCYRTENYQVPVTTITNDCATGNCGTCSTGTCGNGIANSGCTSCGTAPYGSAVPTPGPANYSPTPSTYAPPETVNGTYYEYPTSTTVPNGTISTGGGYNSSGQPADMVPSLQGLSPQSSTRPVLDRLRQGHQDWTTSNQLQATYPLEPTPAVRSYSEKTARTPERKEWSYSPVRLASYTTTEVGKPSALNRPTSTTSQPLQIRGTFRNGERPSASQQDLNGWVEVE